MKTPLLIAPVIAAFAVAGVAQAQIKAGIPPKSMAQIRAERAAKAEREHRMQLASETERRREAAFDRLDRNRDGRVSRDEYHAAGAIEEAAEAHAPAGAPHSGAAPSS